MSGASGIEHDPAAALNKPPREHSRWLAMRARAARVPLAVAGAAPLIGGVLLVIQAWLLARVLDQAIVQGAARAELATSIVAIAALMLARAALAWLGERAGAAAAERIKRQVREALFARLLALGPQWSRQRASGELASAMVEQVEALDAFFAKYLPAMGAAAVLPVAFAVVVLPVDVIAGLLLLVTAPLIPLFMALVGWGAEAASRRHLQAFARLSGFFADRLRGLATLKLYGRAEAEAQSVVAASDALRQRTMAVLRIAFLSSAVLEFFAALGVAGVAVYIGLTYLGFLDVRASVLTLQGGFFCLLLAPEVYGPLRQFAAHYHDRAAARAAVAQIARTFDGLPSPGVEPAPPAQAPALARRAGACRERPDRDAAGPPRAGAARSRPAAGRRRARRIARRQRRRQDDLAGVAGALARRRRRHRAGRRAVGRLGRSRAARTRGADRSTALSVRRFDRRQHPPGAAWRQCRAGRGGGAPRLRHGVRAGFAARPGHAAGQSRPWPVGRAGAACGAGAPVPARPRADPAGRACRPPGCGDTGARARRGPGLRAGTHLAAGHACRRGGAAPAAAMDAGAGPPAGVAAGMSLWRLLFRLYARRKGALALALALSLLTVAAGVGLLGVSGWFLTGAALAGAGAVFNLFVPSSLVRGLSFIRIASRYGERLAGHAATLRLLADLRASVFRSLVRLTPRQLARYRGGDLVARLTSDVDALDTVFLFVLAPVAVALAGGAILTAVMGAWIPAAALVVAAALLLCCAVAPWWLARAGRRPGAAVQESAAALRAATLDAVEGHADIAALHAGAQARAQFADACEQSARARAAQVRIAAR
ncbi:ATP-binding/permease protein CydD family protein, partial [Bordetella bronchiseptica CA90 BB1334]